MSAAIPGVTHLASLVEMSNDAIITKSLDGTVLSWNPAAERIFGFTAKEMLGQKMLRLFPPDRYAEEDYILQQIAAGERIEHFTTQRVRKDGRLIDVSVSLSPICDASGNVVAASKIARDITRQVLAEQEIAQYKAMIDGSDDGIISKDRSGVIRTWNKAAEQIFGYTAEEAVGQHVRMLFPAERWHEEEKLIKTVLDGGSVRHFRTTRVTKSGERIFVSVSLSAIRSRTGDILGFSKIVRDLTQEIRQEQMLWQVVHYDGLTGLLNRVGFQGAVEDLIRISQVRHRSIAVVRCTLDGFSEAIKTQPPHFANRLLVAVAQSMREVMRQADDVARLHGDQFAILLQGFTHIESIPKAVEKIRQAVADVAECDGIKVELSARMGVAIYPEDGKTYSTLVRRAESAMHASLLRGGGAQYFSGVERTDVPPDFFLVRGLFNAVEAGQLSMVYQPIVNVGNGEIRKAEALVRWQHPELGMVPPSVFIPLAEKYGLIRDISRWVLRQAMADLARWTGLFGMDFQVSVNRSSHDLHDYEDCMMEMRDGLHHFGLCGSNLIVEITEHSLMENALLTEKILAGYRNLDIGVALDDFGTGYSSLEYLTRYPVNFLKVDKSFVDPLVSDSVYYQLCDGIISIAKRLGIQVVAEGVETETQARLLGKMGADYLQGYRYAKPMSAQQLEAFMLHRQAAND